MSLLFTPQFFLLLYVLKFAENVGEVLFSLFDNVNLLLNPALSFLQFFLAQGKFNFYFFTTQS